MLNDIITVICNRLKANVIGGLNDRNTDRAFVSPVLRELGWPLDNLEEVVADYTVRDLEQSTNISYALLVQGLPLLLVDIKPLYSDLRNLPALAKVFATAIASLARYLTVTNGVEWFVYQIDTLADKQDLILTIDIRADDAAAKLSLLARNTIGEGLLERYSKDHPVNNVKEDKEVKSRGYKVTDHTHEQINALRQLIMTNRAVKDQDITNSLIVETGLKILIESLDYFNHMEISNATILKQRMEEAFKKRFK